MLVFAGAGPDYDTQGQVCNAMAAAQAQANAALPLGVEVTSLCCWQDDEYDEPKDEPKPGLIDNLLADGITIMQPVSGQPT